MANVRTPHRVRVQNMGKDTRQNFVSSELLINKPFTNSSTNCLVMQWPYAAHVLLSIICVTWSWSDKKCMRVVKQMLWPGEVRTESWFESICEIRLSLEGDENWDSIWGTYGIRIGSWNDNDVMGGARIINWWAEHTSGKSNRLMAIALVGVMFYYQLVIAKSVYVLLLSNLGRRGYLKQWRMLLNHMRPERYFVLDELLILNSSLNFKRNTSLRGHNGISNNTRWIPIGKFIKIPI